MKKISECQVLDHGFDHSQYFPGCGVSCTEFDDVSTGIGDTSAEALDDAIDGLAQRGYDVEGLYEKTVGALRWPNVTTREGCLMQWMGEPEDEGEDEGEGEDEDDGANEIWAFVSVRVK